MSFRRNVGEKNTYRLVYTVYYRFLLLWRFK